MGLSLSLSADSEDMGSSGSRSFQPLAKPLTLNVEEAAVQGRRSTQEDRHTIVESMPNFEHIAFFGVYDGHNGVQCAAFCENRLHHAVSTHALKKRSEKELEKKCSIKEDKIANAFVDIDSEFLRVSDEEPADSGCTVAMALLNKKNGRLVTANSGDARIVVSRHFKAERLTVDHKPSVKAEQARIEAAGHSVIDGRLDGVLAVSRAMGDLGFKSPHMNGVVTSSNLAMSSAKELDPKDMPLSCVPQVHETMVGEDCEFIIIACDGLYDVMSDQEVVDWVSAKIRETQLKTGEESSAAAAATTAAGAALVGAPDGDAKVEVEVKQASSPEARSAKPPVAMSAPAATSLLAPPEKGSGFDSASDIEEESSLVIHEDGDGDGDGITETKVEEFDEVDFEAARATRGRSYTIDERTNGINLGDVMPSGMRSVLFRPMDLKDAMDKSTNLARQLAIHAISCGSMDNVSVIVIRLMPDEVIAARLTEVDGGQKSAEQVDEPEKVSAQANTAALNASWSDSDTDSD